MCNGGKVIAVEPPVRAVLIGLGKLGLTVAEGLLDRRDVEIVGAFDQDPAKVGKDLGELVDRDPIGVSVSDAISGEAANADVALLMTSSRMLSVVDSVGELLRLGLNVVTSAEELAYPWREFPAQSEHLDAIAREHGCTVLGTGANPGFLMDVLPSVLTVTTQEVMALRVRRTMDLRPHRPARLTRFAIGRTEEQFYQTPASEVHGHIGFRQSIDAIADALSLPVDRVIEQPLRPSVIADNRRNGDHVSIEAGTIAVLSQSAAGYSGEHEVIRLEENFGFVDDGDPIAKGDGCVVTGIDQEFTISVEPGVLSFVTTPAVLINMTVPTVRAEAGLRTMLDFTVRDVTSKGAARNKALARRR
jgi:2,4-diaminopentanoate dehydrogenase